jgi:hypothetical protein
MATELVAVVKQIYSPFALEDMRVAQHVRIPAPGAYVEQRILVVPRPVREIVGISVPDPIPASGVRSEVE